MNQVLEIPDAVYAALVKAAEQNGTTPTGWIIAHLPSPVAIEPQIAATDDDPDELAEGRPWRGVYAPSVARTILFTQEIDTANLPKCKPGVNVDSRRMESDDECGLV
jgi:hypothetical protein